MTEVEKTERIISKKATFYKHCNVHLVFQDGDWENGYIEEVGADHLILRFITEHGVARWGSESRPFFFLEIKDIEEFRQRLPAMEAKS